MSQPSVEELQIPDVKKVLGNPKITFVLGGPASGKGTQCAKLVEEFGYTHISTGDLFRAEVAKGSREGEMMKRIMNEGGLIPYQLTVQVLVNGMIENPSKNYLIDGFPRAKDQAIYFEQIVGEAQQVLFFNVPKEVCVARCMERAKSSGRSDDTEEVIRARLETYENQSKPVVEMYQKFGKVREVDGSGEIFQTWHLTRAAMLPQISWLVGPMCSGKTSLGNALCERTNAKMINYSKFLKENNMESACDDDQVQCLIHALANEISPRVVLEGFPRTLYQAKFFIMNAKHPKNCFVLSCSKDLSQERMLSVPQDAEGYLPSSLLSKKIGEYNKNLVELMPFLEQIGCNKICTEEAFNVSFKQMCGFVEPTVVSVRSSGSKEGTDAKNQVLTGLVQQGYVSLEVSDLIQLEVTRQTEVGVQIQEFLNVQNNVWSQPQLIVQLLKRIIYSGLDNQDKFLLVGFPDQIEHAEIMEEQCCSITVIVYTTNAAKPIVELKGEKDGDLTLKCLDSMFAKQFRLRVTTEWNPNSFEDMLGKKVQWGIIHGRQYAGSDECAKKLASMINGKSVDMKAISEDLKKKMGTEEEPFEGDVPMEEVENAICDMISKDRAAGNKHTYIFNSWEHKSATEFVNAIHGVFGLPNFCIHCVADQKTVDLRWCKANEVEEVSEDARGELQEAEAKDAQNQKEFDDIFKQANIENKKHEVTSYTMEAAFDQLKNIFSAKVILVNHEKRLDVDTVCSNLAIRYNMMYFSVYQLIRQHIQEKSAWGKALMACKKPKALNDNARVKDGDDEFEEADYSAAHFDMKVVLQMLQATLMEKRTGQNFVLLEGLCNQGKLMNEEDRLVCRNMDELFMIEKGLGQIAGCVNLTFKMEPTEFVCDKMEEFEEPVVEEKKVELVLDEEGNPLDPQPEPAEAPAEEEGGEDKKPKFNPAEYKWTITNKVSKNMPQVFKDFKGANCIVEEKSSASFADVQQEAVTLALDAFCSRILADHNSKYIY